MANEVKRWRREARLATMLEHPEGRWVKFEDHDCIVAEKDAEIENLKKSLEDSMAQVMVAVHSETNTGWPHEKKLHETIAEQKRVIEKLRISMATALELESCGETSCPIPMRAMCSTPSHKELRKTLLEITAIEQGEGT